jgi:hypothetical protein
MSRLTDALMTGAYVRNIDRPVLDLKYGGQQGWAPNLTELVSNQAYVTRPLICILLEVPKMFTIMPDSQKWIGSIKALFELHARSIDGFNAALKVDFDQHPVGGAGEEQEEVTNVTREKSSPKFTFIEKYGRPIQTLLEYWIMYGMMSPEAKYAMIGTMTGGKVTDLLSDWFTATCLFVEPDPLHKNVSKAWITTNMMPKGTGDITAKRDLTSAQEMLTLDVEFTGVSQYGIGVNLFAQNILKTINITHADPFMRPAFIDKISPDVAAIDGGYKKQVETMGSSAVTNLDT